MAAEPVMDGAGAARWRRLLAALPWLLAIVILGWLFHRLPVDKVVAAVTAGPWAVLTAYIAAELAILLVVDAWATGVTLRRCGGSPPFREVLAMRGATYLLNLVHYAAGQGAFGWYLARDGRGGWGAGAALMVIFVTQGLALVVVLCLGLLLAPAWIAQRALPLVALAVIGLACYFAVIGLRPRWAERVPLLRPLLAAGVGGHLVAVVARLPHMVLLVLLNWGVYICWGIPIPLRYGLATWPLLLSVSALPITPAGLGTVQALQVTFFSRFAAGPDLASRQASVLAVTLASYALSLLLQVGIGAISLRWLRRDRARAAESGGDASVLLP